jgi:transposase
MAWMWKWFAIPAIGRWHTDSPHGDLFDAAAPQGFVLLPKRWVVERTHAWVERSRRLIMHHDRAAYIATNWVWLAEARMLARRLASQAG